MKRLLLVSLLFLILLTACSNNKGDETYLPASIGPINSLAVVIDNDLQEGSVGDTVRRYFTASIDELPNEEPTFSLYQMPPQVLEGNTRNSRNVLIVNRGNQPQGAIKENVYAKPQVVAVIEVKKVRDIACKIEEYHRLLISAFKENELAEMRHRFQKSLNTKTEYTQALGAKLQMPSFYKIIKHENNFFWIKRPIKGGRASVILYETPLKSIPTDEERRAKAIVKMCDSIGEKYTPGPEKGTYMVTETYLVPSVSKVKVKNHFALESKGLWEVKGFALGGPYINYIIEDKAKNRLLVAEGFLYAPGVSKRDVLFELEATIKSISFND